MPAKEELPSTLQRSSKKAQDTWSKAHDSAVDIYGEGERAHRTAFSALKRGFEKVGDHWEAKDGKGPSDPRSKAPRREARAGKGKTYGGVDVEGRTKKELLDLARKVDVKGRSHMTKDELGEAIQQANTRKTADAREHQRSRKAS